MIICIYIFKQAYYLALDIKKQKVKKGYEQLGHMLS